MPTDTQDALVFRAEPLAPGEVRLLELRGRDRLSRLFELQVLVETQSRDYLDPDHLAALPGARAHVAFGASEELPLHGIIRDVELREGASPGQVLYRITLVPRLWRLARTLRSRVFQDATVPEIVEAVIREAGLTGADDLAMRIAAKHPRREYTVQYQETDLDFLSRLMEYEGMFYFFEHGARGDAVVIADSSSAFGELPSHERVPLVPRSGALTASARGVSSISQRRRVVERAIQLVDYNYRTPAVHLAGAATVDEIGVGDRLVYGEHFKTVDDGQRLAAIRAEERRCLRETYKVRTNLPGLLAGRRFTLVGHDLDALDQAYVITEARLAADQSWAGDDDAPRGYRAKLAAIPAGVAFRPARVTPWPRITGLLHARVDGAQRTSIDEHGRYKILLPFDSAEPGAGRASRWIRMAQPLSGPAGKLHFPLEVGTEVLLGHIDGDPDRPIIVGAVPNHETPSPVVARNAMQSVITTRSGIRVILDDEAGPT